jgi:hypothetical protein
MAIHYDDDFAEGRFVAAFGVVAEQLDIGFVVHSPIKQPRRKKSGKVFRGFVIAGAQFRHDVAVKALCF